MGMGYEEIHWSFSDFWNDNFFPAFAAEKIFQASIFVITPGIYYFLIRESFTLSTFLNYPRFFAMGYENDVLGMKD